MLKGSILGVDEGEGVSQIAREKRLNMPIDKNGFLTEDVDLEKCTPSFAGVFVMNQSTNDWMNWKNQSGKPVDIYRRTE